MFFVAGLFALLSVLQNAPLFARNLQVTGIGGQTSVPQRAANFDHGPYLLETAIGFVNADFLSYATIEAPDEVASGDTFTARAETAVSLLEDSLARDPASAYAWAYYAQALLFAGHLEAAREALVVAQDMAPHQYYIAFQRLTALEGIHLYLSTLAEPGRLTDAEYAAGLRDIAVLEARFGEGRLPKPDWIDR